MDSLSSVGTPPIPPSPKLSELPNEFLKHIVEHLSTSDARNLGYALPKKTGALAQWAFEDFARREIGLGGTADERAEQTRALFSQLREWIEKGWIPEPYLRWKPPTRIGVSEIDVWATLYALKNPSQTRWFAILANPIPAAHFLRQEMLTGKPNFFSPLWQYLLNHWLGKVMYKPGNIYSHRGLVNDVLREALRTKNQPLFQMVTSGFQLYAVDYEVCKEMILLNWTILPPRGYEEGYLPRSFSWSYYLEWPQDKPLKNLLIEAVRTNATNTLPWFISKIIGHQVVRQFFVGLRPAEENPFFEACRLGRTRACALLWESLEPSLQKATPEEKKIIGETLTRGHRIAAENGHADIVGFLTRVLDANWFWTPSD